MFTKHENGEYYLTPLGVDSDKYIQESDNLIPPQWFFLFENSEKKFFYSHAGDGAVQPDGIYYNTDSASSKKRLEEIIESLSNVDQTQIPKELDFFIKELQFGLSEILLWISKFSDDSMIVLNYAELTSVIHEFTLKNENSVEDLWVISKSICDGDYDKASSNLRIYKQKWEEISSKCGAQEKAGSATPKSEPSIQ